jgi:transposase
MYLNVKVEIPNLKSKIVLKSTGNSTYVNYEYDRVYNPEKKYNVPKRTTIGKVCEDEKGMMYPNGNYLKYFPEVELPIENTYMNRSSCLRIGAFLVIRELIKGYQLDEMIERIVGKDSGLFLDLLSYSIICENNVGQYYPDYAYNHPLFTSNMRVYSDSKVSDFINGITHEQSAMFLNEWNEKRSHRERIYITYDSTNKNCQAGEIDMVELGNPKDNQGKPVFNYSIAYDGDNKEPLFYEEYPGSIVDVSQLRYMLQKAEGYGYKNVGFILDRGYFSEENIRYMDKNNYDFVIMVKGMKKLVSALVQENKGTFEEIRAHSIKAYGISGKTVTNILYPTDEKERHFHIYHSSQKYATERDSIEKGIERMAISMKKREGQVAKFDKSFEHYYDLIYHHQGQEDEVFMYGREKEEVVEREIQLCGYFVIITSQKMTAEAAYTLYKSRDGSEKLFRGDKSYLGNKSLRVHSNESISAKIFIEFVALIIRNKIYTCLKDEMIRNDKRLNYMTVPAAIKELEKIEMVRLLDNVYRLDHAITSTQKSILKAFGLNVTFVTTKAREIGEQLVAMRGLE